MSSPLPSCFRPSTTTTSNLTVYHTETGPVSITWSRSMVGRSLHVEVHHDDSFDSLSFHLHITPFLFWKKHGSKKLAPNTHLFWNLSKAKFSSSPEPLSAFYVALVVHNRITLLLGDSPKEAHSNSKAHRPNTPQLLLLQKEHVFADTLYSTRAAFAGKARLIQIDWDHSRLSFIFDGETVFQIKRLKWKFRGNHRVLVDGVHVQISWDIYNWLFHNHNHNHNNNAHAIFIFKFQHHDDQDSNWNLGASEWAKMGKSCSSSSTGSFSSVLEWSSVEENQLLVPVGFSLLVYAWKR
ncbi:uncharacterized protein LOC109797309 [Cajanus cajan]|nr:uncharacterized protein LOC109797309 [Cajanus cajan]